MNVSYQWLADYVDLTDLSATQLAERLTRAGIEVRAVHNRNQGLDGIVVGYIVTKEKHPNADKLNICQVDTGVGERLQIVCGADNVAAGQKVAVATIGTLMPGGMKIKRSKLRGVESQGMICSAQELGLPEKLLSPEMRMGIFVLPADTVMGMAIATVLGLDDQVLELDLTPNRSDCLSMLGVAYEVGALLQRPVHIPASQMIETGEPASYAVKINVDYPKACTLYALRYICNVKITASPLWLQTRLLAAGIRPLNNVVDVTNYVMLEYGQPLHAFDANQLHDKGARIQVRFAHEGESLITLDGKERKLTSDMLVITDHNQPIALAGVMGGANTEVSADTTDILLEAACFAGIVVRKTARQFGICSEASLRFEKEVNQEMTIPALNRAAQLLYTIAGGDVRAGIVEQTNTVFSPSVIPVTLTRINGLLGTSLTAHEVQMIMERLGFLCAEKEINTFHITIPLRRGDITHDVDVIEEIARIFGYHHIPTTALAIITTNGRMSKKRRILRALRHSLTANGLYEVLTYSFTHVKTTKMFPSFMKDKQPIRLAMPLSEERSVLRTSLLPSLLDVASYNQKRKQKQIHLFEIGTLYLTSEKQITVQPQEEVALAIVLAGERQQLQWNVNAAAIDFYDIKGVIDGLFSYLGLCKQIRYVADGPQGLHPGRSASIYLCGKEDEQYIGFIGQLHPDVQHTIQLTDSYVAEILLRPLFEEVDFAVQYCSLPRYPAVERDLSIVLERNMEVDCLIQVAQQAGGRLLESINVFDVYMGDHIAQNKKSVSISLVYRHPEHTFTDKEITQLHDRIVTAIETNCKAELRK